MESGEVQVTEWSNYALAARLKAAAEGVSFGLIRSMLGTDTFEIAKVIESVHRQEVRRSAGHLAECVPCTCTKPTCTVSWMIQGISVADLELARAAKHLIITTERLVNDSVIRDKHRGHIHPVLHGGCRHEGYLPTAAIPATCPIFFFG